MSLPESTPNAEDPLAPPTARHAVWCYVLPVGTGDGSEQMVSELLAPRYQLTRRGIAFAASPRHAQIVLVLGALTRVALEPAKRVIAQVPEPRAIVAIGDAFLTGGVFAGSPMLVPQASDALGANIEIVGDPPTPTQILAAIEAAIELLDEPHDDNADGDADAMTADDADGDADAMVDDSDLDAAAAAGDAAVLVDEDGKRKK